MTKQEQAALQEASERAGRFYFSRLLAIDKGIKRLTAKQSVVFGTPEYAELERKLLVLRDLAEGGTDWGFLDAGFFAGLDASRLSAPAGDTEGRGSITEPRGLWVRDLNGNLVNLAQAYALEVNDNRHDKERPPFTVKAEMPESAYDLKGFETEKEARDGLEAYARLLNVVDVM